MHYVLAGLMMFGFVSVNAHATGDACRAKCMADHDPNKVCVSKSPRCMMRVKATYNTCYQRCPN